MIKLLKNKVNLVVSHFRATICKAKRSGKWRALEKKFLAQHNACEVCGTSKHLQVHHIKPFHLYPELELEESNLIVVCMDSKECHLRIGHGGNFKDFCPEIKKYAQEIKNKEKTFEQIYEIAKKERIGK